MAEEKKVPWIAMIILGSALATVTTLAVKYLWDRYVKKYEV